MSCKWTILMAIVVCTVWVGYFSIHTPTTLYKERPKAPILNSMEETCLCLRLCVCLNLLSLDVFPDIVIMFVELFVLHPSHADSKDSHWSALTFRPLTGEVKNADYLVIIAKISRRKDLCDFDKCQVIGQGQNIWLQLLWRVPSLQGTVPTKRGPKKEKYWTGQRDIDLTWASHPTVPNPSPYRPSYCCPSISNSITQCGLILFL